MALVPLFNNVTQEQLGGNVPGWFNKYLNVMNDFCTKVKYALSGQINYTTNIACNIINLTFTTPSDYNENQNFPNVTFTNTLATNPFKVEICEIDRTKGGSGFDSPSIPIWTQSGNTISINWIGGLQDSCTYSITVKSS